MMKIGDLASRSGVSIRTLLHYDDIGLLSPSGRTESGHRLYGREEVVRLQQVLPDPKDPRVQALAARWKELIEMFTGGDPGIAQSLSNFYRGEPHLAAQQGLSGGMSEYVKKALS